MMKEFLILITIHLIESYHLFPIQKNDTIIEMRIINEYGPILLKRCTHQINIYADGMVVVNKIYKFPVLNFNQSVTTEVYFREIDDVYSLSKYSNYVKEKSRYFMASWGVLISWKYHYLTRISQNGYNEFQFVLLSNTKETFSITNFHKLGKLDEKLNVLLAFGLKNYNNTELLFEKNTMKKGFWITKHDNIENKTNKNYYSFLFIILNLKNFFFVQFFFINKNL